MKFEHFAFNSPDARAQAAWWVEHLGLTVARRVEAAPHTHFLADETGRVFIEIYSNPATPYPDYANQPPLVLHVAFVSTDTKADRARLEKAGATFVVEETPGGNALLMMRDPWGLALQFCQRTQPF
ncbi:glyoxylase I family protein [Ereboglobus sp. PH5-5]|uniref:VOC family protein n=1 Tax=unclassified Ereboglobus TaxID=2626932 RepID=UPI002405DA58|nr:MULTISPECIES: VOC family protein [unclassified Ereboglobus]MDF9826339.1 glyoxylase I family protein [Ereboglobus sp. PH5-10]MDF9833042.1 glyoxylase I family protein [Ereboglobus sp. PH5-5]